MSTKQNQNRHAADTRKTKPATPQEMANVKCQYEENLEDSVKYTGQFKCARELLVKLNEYTPEAIAMMTDVEVCRSLQMKYKLVIDTDESILLVERAKLGEFNAMIHWLYR